MAYIVPAPSRALLGVVAFALVVGGCGGGSTYSYEQGSLAQRFLPTDRTVEYHPDSLGALSIEKREGQFQFELESNYEALHRKWSCTYQSMGAGRSRRGPSYATLWSLELSLVSLQPEFGISSLSEEQARKRMQERRQKYDSTIQIDVFWFEEDGNSLLAGPGSQVELRIDGERYSTAKESHGPLRDTFVPDRAETAIFRRNTFYFPRVVDSTDILKDAQRVELRIDRVGSGSGVRFVWSWEDERHSSARLRKQENVQSVQKNRDRRSRRP